MPLPSDMMPASYRTGYFLSLLAQGLHASLLKKSVGGDEKMKMTRHNGRAGKNGVYNPKQHRYPQYGQQRSWERVNGIKRLYELEEQKPRRNINVLGLVDIFVDRGPFHLPLLCRALCRQAQAERRTKWMKLIRLQSSWRSLHLW